MIVVPNDKFIEHLKKIKDTSIIERAEKAVEKLKEANSLREVTNIEYIKGHTNFYRLRFGDYRIGFYYIEEEQKVELYAIGYRSKIYDIFP